MNGAQLLNYMGLGQGGLNPISTENTIGGSHGVEGLHALLKSLDAGSITGRETTNLTTASGAPLKVESLEKQLKVLTHSMKDIVSWQMIPKKPATNTVEEYNQLQSYGNDFAGGSYNEGERPDEETSIYVRRASLVKFYGSERGISHPMMLVNTATVANVKDQENKNGTMYLLRKVNRDITFGDEVLVPQDVNGLFAQHQRGGTFGATLQEYLTSECVIDLRGGSLTETTLNQGAGVITQNFGTATDFMGPNIAIQKFSENFYGNKRVIVGGPGNQAIEGAVMGQRVKAFASSFGDINLTQDRFLDNRRSITRVTPATSALAPAPPTAAPGPSPVAVAAVASDAQSLFTAGDAGNYLFLITAFNNRGESAPLEISSTAVAVVAGGAVDLAWLPAIGGAPATGFWVYRSRRGATANNLTPFERAFRISTAERVAGYDGGAANVVRDKNRFIPGTVQGYMLQADNEVYEVGQLAPLMSMDLAIMAPKYQWMILMYWTMFLYASRKFVRYINMAGS